MFLRWPPTHYQFTRQATTLLYERIIRIRRLTGYDVINLFRVTEEAAENHDVSTIMAKLRKGTVKSIAFFSKRKYTST